MTKLITPRDLPIGQWPKLSLLIAFITQDNDIYRFFRENIKASYQREEGLVHICMAVVLLEALIFFTLNHFVFHYTPLPLFICMFTTMPVGFLVWWSIGHVHRLRWPKFGLISTTFANLGFATIIFFISWAGIITTPFVIIDYHLVAWDQFFGFNVAQFMAWAYQFPWLIKTLNFCYFSWQYQIILAPLLLAVLKKSREINHYFIASSICFMICVTIYYFFPTVAPAGVMNSPYFDQGHYNLVTRFYEIHQHLPITAWGQGIVSFPSGHVIFSLLVLFSLRQVKWAFYLMLVINFFLVMATMALGYHYLVDVLASFIIVAVVLAAMHFYFKKSQI